MTTHLKKKQLGSRELIILLLVLLMENITVKASHLGCLMMPLSRISETTSSRLLPTRTWEDFLSTFHLTRTLLVV